MMLEDWFRDAGEPCASDPVSLLAVVERLDEVFGCNDPGGWRDRLDWCIIELFRIGKRPMVRDLGTGVLNWTDDLFDTENGRFETPEAAAETVLNGIPAFGTEWAEPYWFGTYLPETPD